VVSRLAAGGSALLVALACGSSKGGGDGGEAGTGGRASAGSSSKSGSSAGGSANAGSANAGGPSSGGSLSGVSGGGSGGSVAAEAGASSKGGNAPVECPPECLRPYNCVNECRGPVVSSGCCKCLPPAFDNITCGQNQGGSLP
jgi:hypothetical protein